MRIRENTRLAGYAFTLSIATIVERKDGDAVPIGKLLQVWPQITDAIAVAVAVQEHRPRIGVLDQPAVQLCAVGRSEFDVFVEQISGGPVPFGVLRRRIEQPVL